MKKLIAVGLLGVAVFAVSMSRAADATTGHNVIGPFSAWANASQIADAQTAKAAAHQDLALAQNAMDAYAEKIAARRLSATRDGAPVATVALGDEDMLASLKLNVGAALQRATSPSTNYPSILTAQLADVGTYAGLGGLAAWAISNNGGGTPAPSSPTTISAGRDLYFQQGNGTQTSTPDNAKPVNTGGGSYSGVSHQAHRK